MHYGRRMFSRSGYSKDSPHRPGGMELELKAAVRLLAQNRWRFRLHTTYDGSIPGAFQRLRRAKSRDTASGLHWFIDHAETISQRDIDRMAALGGGIAIQNRMAGRAFSGTDTKAKRTQASSVRSMVFPRKTPAHVRPKLFENVRRHVDADLDAQFTGRLARASMVRIVGG